MFIPNDFTNLHGLSSGAYEQSKVQVNNQSPILEEEKTTTHLEKLDTIIRDHDNLPNTSPTESKYLRGGLAALGGERDNGRSFLDIHNVLCRKKLKFLTDEM